MDPKAKTCLWLRLTHSEFPYCPLSIKQQVKCESDHIASQHKTLHRLPLPFKKIPRPYMICPGQSFQLHLLSTSHFLRPFILPSLYSPTRQSPKGHGGPSFTTSGKSMSQSKSLVLRKVNDTDSQGRNIKQPDGQDIIF